MKKPPGNLPVKACRSIKEIIRRKTKKETKALLGITLNLETN